MAATFRAPRAHELERLRDIERVAGEMFAGVGLGEVAEAEPASVEELAEYAQDGRAFVVTDGADTPVGYAIVDVVDGLAHLEQLSVVPDHGRRGLGAALLDRVAEWAREQHFAAITLTTFAAVPWNAPYYAKHGYRVMTDDEIGPQLAALRAHEAEHGLDPTQRVCMRREIAP